MYALIARIRLALRRHVTQRATFRRLHERLAGVARGEL
jgi:hypothetical protein